MNERDHNVSLVFGDMRIKQVLLYNEKCNTIEGFEDFGFIGQTKYMVNHATAFVVRGLASKWKQPLGYFLSSGPIKSTILKVLTKECIGKLEKTGLNVVAIVCDQGSNNRSFLHQMENVTLKKWYITMHKIWWQKDICALWPSHFLKNIQNNLKKNDLNINGKIVSWQYIVDFYDELSVYEFLQNKTYQEAGCLVNATPAMITFVDRLDTLFCGIFEGIIHMP